MPDIEHKLNYLLIVVNEPFQIVNTLLLLKYAVHNFNDNRSFF